MPIKYQCLGGGKELLNVTINTGVRSTVTFRGETKQTDESANVTFSRVPIGVHTVTIKINEMTFTKKIKVVSQLNKCGLQVKDLPIGSKIKFSSGKKFVLMAKDHPIHDAGSATFLSEFIIERALWGGNSWCYKQSNIHKTILPSYYEELNPPEKNAIINYEFTAFDDNAYNGHPQCPDAVGKDSAMNNDFISDKYPGAWSNPVDIMRSYFYLPNSHEYGGTVADGDGGKNLGFSSDKDRIKRYENGDVGDYFTRTSGSPYRGQSYIDYEYITENGYFGSTNGPDSVNVYRGVVPACDISQDAFVTLDNDGYYRILGM